VDFLKDKHWEIKLVMGEIIFLTNQPNQLITLN